MEQTSISCTTEAHNPQCSLFVIAPLRWMKGCAYGVAQSTFVGRIDIEPLAMALFPAAYGWLLPFIGRDPRDVQEHIGGPPDVATALALAVTAVQRSALIATSRERYLAPISGPDGTSRFLVAFSFEYRAATLAVIQWLHGVGQAFARTSTPAGSVLRELERRHSVLLQKLRVFSDRGQNRFFILQTAYEKGIPAKRLPGSVQLLGQGSRARLFDSSITERTGSIGIHWAADKRLTAHILRRAGLPAPVHREVASADDARSAADELGYPVVIKPADMRGGIGVFADIREPELVGRAFAESRKYSKNVLVERHFEGDGHRLTVMDGRVIRVTRKRPWGVTGDGRSSVAELILASKERGGRADLDGEAHSLLRQNGLTASAVLAEGHFLALRRRNNASADGETITLPIDTVHNDNLALALRAAATLRLDMAGVDLLIADISRSWMESGALICEVNAQPQMSGKLVEQMVTEQIQGDGRIPVFLLIVRHGNKGSDIRTAIGIPHALQDAPFSTATGVWMGSKKLCPASNAFAAARILLEMPDIEKAVCVTTVNDILRFGLPCDRFNRIFIPDAPLPPGFAAMLAPHAPKGAIRSYRQLNGVS